MVFGGILLLALYAIDNSYRHYASVLFAFLGLVAVLADPDISHFVRNPLIFLSTDLVFTALLLVGTPFTVFLLITALQAQRRVSANAS